MCVITFTSILQKKHSYSVFPQHIKVHALKVKPFAFFKWSVCESMPQINSPADGDKWPAGQKESQEAAPSITTMNYSPSLSLNFQRRMIRQRRANPQQKRSICKVWISNVTAATRFRLSYKAVSNIIRFEKRWIRGEEISPKTHSIFGQSHVLRLMNDLTWERSDMSRSTPILPRVRLKNRLSRLWWLEREEKWSRKRTDNRRINQQICQEVLKTENQTWTCWWQATRARVGQSELCWREVAWRGSIPDNDHNDVTFGAKSRLV